MPTTPHLHWRMRTSCLVPDRPKPTSGHRFWSEVLQTRLPLSVPYFWPRRHAHQGHSVASSPWGGQWSLCPQRGCNNVIYCCLWSCIDLKFPTIFIDNHSKRFSENLMNFIWFFLSGLIEGHLSKLATRLWHQPLSYLLTRTFRRVFLQHSPPPKKLP